MAGELPDPLELKSWEDAFSHPIPTVRKLEQQLRRHADENREKLRTLVGVSYRDLLGTAERIIDMDQQMHNVEAILGQTGQRCNARAVGRMSKSFGKLQIDRSRRCQERNSLASQLAILECCPTVIARILRRKGSLLLAAKLLLLSRLTHKTLSQHAETPPLVDHLRERLALLRSKLLRAIDKRFADPERDVSKLVDDMCAFSLATSSTPSDVLQHFLKIRLRAIQWHLEQVADIHTHAIKAMNLLLNTLRNGQAIFPKRLADTLVRLKDLPLIKQADVQSITELQLGIHVHWLADELKRYTPWPRHDELQKPEADKMLKSWAKSAQRAFVVGLKQALENVTDFDAILIVRQQLFEAWPWANSRLTGLHSADVVDELRETFNDRLSAIIQTQVAELRLVCKSTKELMAQSSKTSLTSTTLWDPSLTDLDVGTGGQQYKNAVLTCYNGFDVVLSSPTQVFDDSLSKIRRIQADLKKMRDAHWDDDFGEDEDEMDSRQTLLSEDDPRTLSECLNVALKAESESLLADFTSLVKGSGAAADDGYKSVVLLRVLREVSKRSALQDKILADVALPLTTSRVVINPLHSSIAAAAKNRGETVLKKSLSRLVKAQAVTGRALWEGKPPLPVQPSAITFKFLAGITAEMSTLGADLWSVAAVDTLKRDSIEAIAKLVAEAIKQLSNVEVPEPVTNGLTAHSEDKDDATEAQHEHVAVASETEPSSDKTADKLQVAKDKLINLVMDLNYFRAALSTGGQDVPQLQQLIGQAATRTELGENEKTRLQKGAADYWRRTYLLFALLAPGR